MSVGTCARMGGNKRTREERPQADIHDVPAKRRRQEYTESKVKLASIYNNLADDVHTVRLQAAGDLIKQLSSKSDDQKEQLDTALTRLVKGLCSGRKAARLGFSIALSEVLRLSLRIRKTESEVREYLFNITDNVVELTHIEGNVSGQERRDHYLGRRYALQAVLQSDVFLHKAAERREWHHFVEAIVTLSSEKPWLRRECGSMLHEYLASREAQKLNADFVAQLMASLQATALLKTPEGVAIWIAVSENFPSLKLPKDVWHHHDPLSPKERTSLVKVMHEIPTEEVSDKGGRSGTRQTSPSFAWQIIIQRLGSRHEGKHLKKFWAEALDDGLFASSASVERKALGLQVCTLALETVRINLLKDIITSGVLRYIVTQRADAGKRHLFEAARLPLNAMVARVKREPVSAGIIMPAIIDLAPTNFDQVTKTKTLDGIISSANHEALHEIVTHIRAAMKQSLNHTDGAVGHTSYRLLADLYLSFVRARHSMTDLFKVQSKTDKAAGLTPNSWIAEIVTELVNKAYVEEVGDEVRSVARARLSSVLGVFLSLDLAHAILLPTHAVTLIHNSPRGRVWSETEKAAFDVLQESGSAKRMSNVDPVKLAYKLLFAMSMIQVNNDEPDSKSALEDLVSSYQSHGHSMESTDILVELLLSFVSRPSSLFRKLAEQTFSAFASELSAEGLSSMLYILENEESLSGQQDLFDTHGSEDGNEEEEGSDEVPASDGESSAVDVEDASDVELINGNEAESSASEDEESSSEEEWQSEMKVDEDEEAVFDRKLKAALGTAAVGEAVDSDDDGSDMDDEQMEALDGHLTTIFKERKSQTNKKQEKKDARENIVNFKNRVLDLLGIYVKSQYAKSSALEVILPLTRLMRKTTSKQTAERGQNVLRQYFDMCNKHKILPKPEVYEAAFKMLEQILDEVKLGGSKLHAGACSRSGLFICKILVADDPKHYENIVQKYSDLQAEWYLDPRSKVHSSVFSEFTSWSISTRKTAQG